MAKRNIHSLDPAASVISRLGGVAQVASITGRDVSRIYRWMAPKSTGGTGGRIPHDDAIKMLQHAREKGLPLTAEEFFAT